MRNVKHMHAVRTGAGINPQGGTAGCRAAQDSDAAASGRAECQGMRDSSGWRLILKELEACLLACLSVFP